MSNATIELLRPASENRGVTRFSHRSGASDSNFQELFYNDSIDYQTGSPHLHYRPLYDRLINLIVEEIAALVERGVPLDVVEVGAGHGGFTESMLAAGCRVTALEMSSPSIRQLEKRFGSNPAFRSEHNPSGGFESIRDAQFSLAACVSVLHHIPDYVSALTDLIGHIRPGGSLIALQEPLWYASLNPLTLRVNRLGYFSWRLRQRNLIQGVATQVRRMRGVYHEDNPADMVEYHVVRGGVNQDLLVGLLSRYFNSVRLVCYWSNHSVAFQRLGEAMSLANTFGIVASDRRP